MTVAALIAGMNVDGNGVELVGLLGLGIAMNLVAALWACAVAMFLRTEQAGALIQMPVFVLLFLAPVFVPVHAAHRMDPRGGEAQPGDRGARGRTRVCSPARRSGGARVRRAGGRRGADGAFARRGLASAERAG